MNGKQNTMALKVPALEMKQTADRYLYSFAIDGKQLSKVAAVSRVKRDEHQELVGYQRPEVLSHIAEIRKYLESSDPLLPNAIVVAFDDSVSFKAAAGRPVNGSVARHGTLIIPVPNGDGRPKPGWVVDGQQRLAAIGAAGVDSFPVFVVGFVARDDEDQREQFILVNATKPLPKGLIYELLPVTTTQLPKGLVRRRFPAVLLERLNLDADSPFHGMIRTPTCPEGVVKDNSILRMLENSLSDGILYWFRDPHSGVGEPEAMLPVLKYFWAAARDVFPGAWGLPPRRSRLLHGAGIVSLGMLMDAIAEGYRRQGMPTKEEFVSELQPIAASCAWHEGHWEFASGERRRWNEIQNTSRDVTLLADHLLRLYHATVRVPVL
jgi:DGQHR domain-containing protein